MKAFNLLNNCDLQILDLANNDLGNDAAQHIRCVMKSIVSLNLSNTKMGIRGCVDLSKSLGEDAPMLKQLDLSGNAIQAEGFGKLLIKLKLN